MPLYNPPYSPADPTAPLVLADDFFCSGAETGEYGDLGWNVSNGTVTGGPGEANHPGCLFFNSSTTPAQVCSFYLGNSLGAGPFDFSNLDTMTFVLKENASAIADVDMRFGLLSSFTAVPDEAAAVSGLFLEKLAADTNWFLVGKAGAGNQTRVDTTVAAGTTNWLNVKFRRHSATEGRVSINGAAEIAVTTDAPLGATVLGQPGVMMVSTDVNVRAVKMDYFSLKTTALVR